MPDSRKCGGGKSGDRSKKVDLKKKKNYLTDFPVLAGTYFKKVTKKVPSIMRDFASISNSAKKDSAGFLTLIW